MNNKTITEFRLSYHMKNYGDLGGCYHDDNLLDLHSLIIVK